MKKKVSCLNCFVVLLFLSACSFSPGTKKALNSINERDMASYVAMFGSDEYMGRMPFTEGETKTLASLDSIFRKLGLEPGFGESYYQDVPMVEVSVLPSETMDFSAPLHSTSLRYKEEYVAFTRRLTDHIFIEDAPVVFAGYGIVAPEYGWNDYEGLDVKGKMVMVLVNDPGYFSGDTDLFKGKEMTYYGRWTYKYEEAARQGALGILIVHQSGPAGYDWAVVRNGALLPSLYLKPSNRYEEYCAVEGWLTKEASNRLFRINGLDPDSLFRSASSAAFCPVELKTHVSMQMGVSYRFDVSRNIMGKISGKTHPEEAIVYTAHWDHLGIGAPVEGDSIYNGAVDNGTSLAWMLEIAQAFTCLDKAPERTVLFLATTSEEQGLLGALYYTWHPVIPMRKTIANINNDLMLPMGRMKDVMITGYGQSSLEELVKEQAEKQDRYILPDPNPHTGMYYRADHFPFAKAGVPALFVRGNADHREFGKDYATEKEKDYLEHRYHQPSDEYDPESWDFSGIAEDARLLFSVGFELANSRIIPVWKQGSEFKSIREQDQNTSPQ